MRLMLNTSSKAAFARAKSVFVFRLNLFTGAMAITFGLTNMIATWMTFLMSKTLLFRKFTQLLHPSSIRQTLGVKAINK